MSVTTKHKLLTRSWTAEVKMLETAIGQFTRKRPLANGCEVTFFEIAGDDELHVNVIHRHPTVAVHGWAGPASLPHGSVHNRRFGGTPPNRILRDIRKMVFADSVSA